VDRAADYPASSDVGQVLLLPFKKAWRAPETQPHAMGEA
jgi:hypothetical protein